MRKFFLFVGQLCCSARIRYQIFILILNNRCSLNSLRKNLVAILICRCSSNRNTISLNFCWFSNCIESIAITDTLHLFLLFFVYLFLLFGIINVNDIIVFYLNFYYFETYWQAYFFLRLFDITLLLLLRRRIKNLFITFFTLLHILYWFFFILWILLSIHIILFNGFLYLLFLFC